MLTVWNKATVTDEIKKEYQLLTESAYDEHYNDDGIRAQAIMVFGMRLGIPGQAFSEWEEDAFSDESLPYDTWQSGDDGE